jgi:hypothetical protein
MPSMAAMAVFSAFSTAASSVCSTDRKNKSPFGAATPAPRLPVPPAGGHPVPAALVAHPVRRGSPVGAARRTLLGANGLVDRLFLLEMSLLDLSNVFLERVPAAPQQGQEEAKEEPKVRKEVTELGQLLSRQDLAEMLKWPFTVGEA